MPGAGQRKAAVQCGMGKHGGSPWVNDVCGSAACSAASDKAMMGDDESWWLPNHGHGAAKSGLGRCNGSGQQGAAVLAQQPHLMHPTACDPHRE